MRASKLKRFSPGVESLGRRELPATGITASISAGVLTVTGTVSSEPIVIDVYATNSPAGRYGYVVVEGVGIYNAPMVNVVAVSPAPWEYIQIRKGPNWNPEFKLVPKTPPPPPPPTNPPGESPNETAAELAIVNAVNTVRAQNGLAPLTLDPRLVRAAHIQANAMASLGIMDHNLTGATYPTLVDRANHVGYRFAMLGENIAFNYKGTDAVMTAWLNSPGHRANILNASFKQIGVGIAYDNLGEPYYAQVFGLPA